jgi:ketosteroid isomerase-like protein
MMVVAALHAAPAAQNQRNSKAKESEVTGLGSLVQMPDPQAIELMLSHMLAAWQVGDVEMLHKHYADDVMVVSGTWEPPLQGWQSYVRAYQAQRARTQSIRLDRTNTFIRVVGNAAWCTYQWSFTGLVDGVQSPSVGHTTLLLEKRAGTWLIVLNHTSVAAPAPQKPAPATGLPQGSSLDSRPAAQGSPGA